jgi:transketolase
MVEAMQPDISIVVAYGHILPKKLIDIPRLGTLNIHASLLPLLRGASPIQAAIRQGWDAIIGDGPFVGMTSFGASAPYKDLYKHFGITAEAVAQAALAKLK